jgi:hypothetical protein
MKQVVTDSLALNSVFSTGPFARVAHQATTNYFPRDVPTLGTHGKKRKKNDEKLLP